VLVPWITFYLFGFRIPESDDNGYLDLRKKLTNLTKEEKMAQSPIGTTARTGQHCPESGVWEVVGTPTTTAPIAEGNVMPPFKGNAVTWKLIQYA
jgi:hypothetical protein